jgi:glycine/D-amino acid oxidase-like deaminating enzyme/nitrite reductase/ring-hydroxylating ferredoxin subunit
MEDFSKSIWTNTTNTSSFPVLSQNIETDIAIVGAGITGMTLAYLLTQKGLKVTVLESDKVGSGVTSYSTGHLTSSIDADYSFISSRIDKDTSRRVAESMQQAINLVEQISQLEHIDCDFVRLSAYQFTEDESKVKELTDEYQACWEAGLPVDLLDQVPLPFPVKKAFELRNQADFHPLKFIQGLSKSILAKGGEIFEHAHVTDIDDQPNGCTITTREGHKIKARKVVLATHTPIQFNVTQTELLPYRSYVVAAKLAGQSIQKGLYWDTLEFYHYIRTYEQNGESYLIVGGEDHKVGERINEKEAFDQLEAYVREKFQIQEITHRWSAELFYSVDGLPFIGKSPFGNNKYIATGYTGDGLIFSVVAAMLLTDVFTGIDSPLEKIYSPKRFHPLAASTDFVEQNLDFAFRFVKDRLQTDVKELSEVPVGEGRLLKVDGKQMAVYRDQSGTIHALSPTCTHMGCIVQWNDADKSWDCPCHGGRFAATGEVLNGPPVEALVKHFVEHKQASK